MIEKRSYGKAELAMLYFPKAASPKVALNRLVRWIKRCPELARQIQRSPTGKFAHFYSKQQVEAIVDFLDDP